MQIYVNQNGTLQEVVEKPFKLEGDLQKLFEANLEKLVRPYAGKERVFNKE